MNPNTTDVFQWLTSILLPKLCFTPEFSYFTDLAGKHPGLQMMQQISRMQRGHDQEDWQRKGDDDGDNAFFARMRYIVYHLGTITPVLLVNWEYNYIDIAATPVTGGFGKWSLRLQPLDPKAFQEGTIGQWFTYNGNVLTISDFNDALKQLDIFAQQAAIVYPPPPKPEQKDQSFDAETAMTQFIEGVLSGGPFAKMQHRPGQEVSRTGRGPQQAQPVDLDGNPVDLSEVMGTDADGITEEPPLNPPSTPDRDFMAFFDQDDVDYESDHEDDEP